MKRLLLCVMLLLPVNGYAMTCEQLYEYWINYKAVTGGASGQHVDAGLYAGYVNGFYEGLAFACEMGKLLKEEKVSALVCLPQDRVSGRAQAHIVGRYLEQNPEEWIDPADTCIFSALTEHARL